MPDYREDPEYQEYQRQMRRLRNVRTRRDAPLSLEVPGAKKPRYTDEEIRRAMDIRNAAPRGNNDAIGTPRQFLVEWGANKLGDLGVLPREVANDAIALDQNLLGIDSAAQSLHNIFGTKDAVAEPTAEDYLNVALTTPVVGGLAVRPVEMLAAKAGRGLMNVGRRALGTRAGRYMTEARPLLDEAGDAIETTFSARPSIPAQPSLAARPSGSAMVEPEMGSTAYGTYELAPGMMTRHRQDVLGDEALREQFSLDPSTSWQTTGGSDTLYDVLGMQQSPTVRMTGIYEPDVPGAPLESNIGFAARPRLRIGPDGNPLPEDYAAMSGAEAVRAVADTQGAGAWSMPTLPSDPERAGALFTPTGSPTDIERLLELRKRGAKYGLADTADLGSGVLLTSFGGLPLGSQTRQALTRPMSLGQGNLEVDVRQALGSSSRPKAVGVASDYINLAPSWMEPEGSGAVSNILRGYLDQMAPSSRDALLEDPRVAQAFGQRFLRDEQARMAGVPVRDDVQRVREAVAEQERLQALFDLIARGRPAMAQGGLVAAGG